MQLSPGMTCGLLLLASNVFMTFAQPVKLDYLCAALCIMGAFYFVFRG